MPLEVTFLDTFLVGKIKLLIVEGYQAKMSLQKGNFASCGPCSFLVIPFFIPWFKYAVYETHIILIIIFIFIFPGYITNQFHNQLPLGLLAKLVSAAQVLQRSGNCNCINCIFTCDNLLST